MKFILEITLGNDAMSTPADIAGALSRIAGNIGDNDTPVAELGPYSSTVYDINGTQVGTWEVTA